MSDITQEIRTSFHIGMRLTSAGAFLLLFVNLYMIGEDGILHLESFAYGIAFGLAWYVPIRPEPPKGNTDG